MLHAYLFWDYEQANKGAGDPRTQFQGGFEFEKDGRKGGVLLLCFCYFFLFKKKISFQRGFFRGKQDHLAGDSGRVAWSSVARFHFKHYGPTDDGRGTRDRRTSARSGCSRVRELLALGTWIRGRGSPSSARAVLPDQLGRRTPCALTPCVCAARMPALGTMFPTGRRWG